MRKLLFIMAMALSGLLNNLGCMAQPVRYSCGFETTEETSDWTTVNGNKQNRWCFGNALSHTGRQSLYISSDNGISDTCIANSNDIVYVYHDFASAGGTCNVSLWCHGRYYSNSLPHAWIVPDTVTPVAGRYPWWPTHQRPSHWRVLLEGGEFTIDSTRWMHFEHELYLAPGRYRLLFLWKNETRTSCAIDDIKIDVHSCKRPADLAFGQIMDTNCTVMWHRRGAAASLVVEYGEGDFEAGSGVGTMVGCNDTICTLHNMQSNALYTVHVRSLCRNGDTSASLSGKVHTLCGELTTADLPWSAGFEDGYYDGPARMISCCLLPSYTLRSTDYAASGTTSVQLCQGQRIVLPACSDGLSGLQISFKALKRNTTYEGTIIVGAMTNPYDESTFTPLATLRAVDVMRWLDFCVGLSGYAGTGKYAVIKCSDDYSNINELFIDDVVLESAPVCPPAVSLRAAKLGTTSTMLTWDICQGYADYPQTFHIAYDNPQSSGFTSTTTRHAILESLLPHEDYTVTVTPYCSSTQGVSDTIRLKTCCANGGETSWSDTVATFPRLDDHPVPTNPSWGNSVCQTIFQRDELLRMGLVPGYIDACALNWQIQTNINVSFMYDKTFSIYIDTTSRVAFRSPYPTTYIPFDTTKRVYKGMHPCDFSGIEHYNFTTPLYWDGQSNIVMTFMTNQQFDWRRERYTYFGCRPVEVNDTVSIVSYQDNIQFREDTVPDVIRDRLRYRPDIILYGGCDTISLCGKPVLYVDSIFGTTVLLKWTHGLEENTWTVEHCDPSGVWIVDDTAAIATRRVYSNLSPNVEYRFRVTANCYNPVIGQRRDTTTCITDCNPANLPIHENFDSWSCGTNASIPNCWHRKESVATGQQRSPYIDNNRHYSGSQSLCLHTYNGQMAWLTMPNIDVDISQLQLSFNILRPDTNWSHNVVVGVMSDPADIHTFEHVATVSGLLNDWEQADVSFASYSGNGHYVALLSPTAGENSAYVDDLVLDWYNPCPRLKHLKVTAMTQNSVTLHWQADSLGGTALIEYGPSGFELGQGTYAATQDDSITITGLLPDNTYDFYLRRVCAEGDTSRITGPIYVKPGHWNTRPCLHDTLSLCGVRLYDDGGIYGQPSPLQSSIITLLPHQEGGYVSLQGTLECGPLLDSLCIYDGLDDNAPLIFRAKDIMQYTTMNVGPFTATNPRGALTLKYFDDGRYTTMGYDFTVSCVDSMPEPCPTPSGLSIADITHNSVNLAWSDTGVFDFDYKRTTDSLWGNPSHDSVNHRQLSSLRSVTVYDWHVRKVCPFNMSEWAVSTFSTLEAPCPRTTGIALNNVGIHDATLQWQENGNSGQWQLLLMGPVRFDTIVTHSPVTLTSLIPESDYLVTVRHLCDTDNVSEWSDTLHFTTLQDTSLRLIPADEHQQFSIHLYPNPASRHSAATLHIANADGDVLVTLLDMTGRELQRHRLACAAGCSHRLDIQSVPQGYYFVKVQSPTSIAIRKLVVK